MKLYLAIWGGSGYIVRADSAEEAARIVGADPTGSRGSWMTHELTNDGPPKLLHSLGLLDDGMTTEGE